MHCYEFITMTWLSNDFKVTSGDLKTFKNWQENMIYQ